MKSASNANGRTSTRTGSMLHVVERQRVAQEGEKAVHWVRDGGGVTQSIGGGKPGMRNPPGEINSGDIPGDFPGDMRGISPGTNFWVFLVLNVTVSYY
uniref:Uncharacterized protein n=1 Tax=Panagrellus redivivus TaxID=6233 RepID=A0A7E4VZ46_PANRE